MGAWLPQPQALSNSALLNKNLLARGVGGSRRTANADAPWQRRRWFAIMTLVWICNKSVVMRGNFGCRAFNNLKLDHLEVRRNWRPKFTIFFVGRFLMFWTASRHVFLWGGGRDPSVVRRAGRETLAQSLHVLCGLLFNPLYDSSVLKGTLPVLSNAAYVWDSQARCSGL